MDSLEAVSFDSMWLSVDEVHVLTIQNSYSCTVPKIGSGYL